MTSHQEELAWAAGFFDGEGHAGIRKVSKHWVRNGKQYGPYACTIWSISINQVQQEPLVRFQRVMGGRVTGPYSRKSARPQFVWQVTNRKDAKNVIGLLLPYVCSIKKAQLQLVLGWANGE